jgi:hypothetical protein
VVGFTTGSRAEVPGRRQEMMMMMMIIIIIMGDGVAQSIL